MAWTEQDLMKYQEKQMKYSKVKPLSETLRAAIDKANDKLPAPLEDQEQENLVQWLRLKGIRHNATANGGHRHKAVAGKLKAQGVVAGFVDITIWPYPNAPTLPILYIEMKRTKGGSISKEQQDWLDYFTKLQEQGYPVRGAVCRGFDQAQQFITQAGY
jgi:hypothetical protein